MSSDHLLRPIRPDKRSTCMISGLAADLQRPASSTADRRGVVTSAPRRYSDEPSTAGRGPGDRLAPHVCPDRAEAHMSKKIITPDSTGIVEVEGGSLRYRIEGQGPPCLVVGSSVCYPRVFSDGLRARLQLIFLDLRHFALTDSAFTPNHVTLDTYA